MSPATLAQAKARQAHGQTAPGRTLSKKSYEALSERRTDTQLAKLAGVSPATLAQAKANSARTVENRDRLKSPGQEEERRTRTQLAKLAGMSPATLIQLQPAHAPRSSRHRR
jgi:DNA-binding XRE family transcriptional regulator